VEFFSYHWLEIVPRKLEGACPIFYPPKLTIDGKKVTEKELTLQYKISTKRSAEIIEGAGLYTSPQTVFLREVLQNALDASKIQLFRDVLSGMHAAFYNPNKEGVSHEDIKDLTPYCFFDKLRQAAQQYRIDYSIEAIDDAGKVLDDKDINSKRKPAGIRFTIRDYGIGIAEEDLRAMLEIGNIKKPKLEAQCRKMPEWLRPTGHFGIGLQAVFYLVKSFVIRSRPRYEKQYFEPPLREMKFYSNRLGGEIDVQLLGDDEARLFGFGTEAIIEIPLRHPQARISFFSGDDNDKKKSEFDIFDETLESMRNKLRGNMEDCFGGPTLLPIRERWPKPKAICPLNEKTAEIYSAKEALGQFGQFCILLEHDLLKYPYSPQDEYPAVDEILWSCWSAERKMLLVYRRPREPSFHHISGRLRVFFKGIQVTSPTKLAETVRIPFWDVDVHLFRIHAGELLEINREKILPEKVEPLTNDIHETHMEFLRFVFKKEEQLAREIAGAEAEWKQELEHQREWLRYVWCEEPLSANNIGLREFYAFAKTYCAYFVSLDERNTAARAYLGTPLRVTSYLHEECFPCFDVIADELKYTDEKGRGNRNPLEISIDYSAAASKPVWFYNEGALPGLTLTIDQKHIPIRLRPKDPADKGEPPKVLRLYPNELCRWPMFAAREFLTLCPKFSNDANSAVAVYRLDQRKGGGDSLVEADEEDYLEFARSRVNVAPPRPVFPSRQGFEKI
jgi:hypothetical protein